jgi:magnesium-protoporphyrin O-methyltransferase
MSSCCRPGAYEVMFGERQARRDLRRYKQRGLPADARRGVEFLRSQGIEGATVLEVGGGIGAAAVELLHAGAERAVNVELSPSYEQAAADLLADARLGAERVERRIGDFVETARAIDAADAVVMNRVVCCYPDYPELLGAAATHARRFLVYTYPRDAAVARAVVRIANLALRVAGREFRAYVHPRRAMLAVAEAQGLRLVEEHRGAVWQVAALART